MRCVIGLINYYLFIYLPARHTVNLQIHWISESNVFLLTSLAYTTLSVIERFYNFRGP